MVNTINTVPDHMETLSSWGDKQIKKKKKNREINEVLEKAERE